MKRRFGTTLLAGMMVYAFALQDASADIYAWVDKSGGLTFSDAPPPAGARLLEVISEGRSNTDARAESPSNRDNARDAEMRILSERMRLLERQIDLASMQPPPARAEYQEPAPRGWDGWGCNGAWADCWWWWSHMFYPAGYGSFVVPGVVVPGAGFRHFHHSHGGFKSGSRGSFVRGSTMHR